ncbi:alternative ribosome rescue aminoacyl-tRNA hydrolase ArfB [Candidatus Berkiella aquae]|uniref:Aminoacyl-tRNA hydrolase n=1 Tax=Candidatus Berkiella aquae TaxID=295108 RepID=A0A0Q9YIS4_9GAMM|nr:alternative ribosome rescue aminoacyl-tRNA hydrolase ArfB [Candidatus Berkiella aquae]MCS5712215.1 aminoacyl-tRNA hydrolase [Candidatus Berkiella aquae]
MKQIDPTELKWSHIRSPGPGGQNVNKVATGVQLRFNVFESPSLSEAVRARLIALLGNKLTTNGDLVIKAIRYRTQNRNRDDALARLMEWVEKAKVVPKKRKATKPSKAAQTRRLDKKKRHSSNKATRRQNPLSDI